MQLEPELDMVIIGAGFGGLRMLCEARKIGLSAKVLDAGADVGGTWYWNRYPGARTDCESWVYCYAFDKGLQDEWDWLERYPSQPQVHAYLRHVADRFDLHRDIELNTRVEGATFDEQHDVWIVTTQAGDRLVCRTLVSAAGPLSVPQEPSYLGLSSFRGDWYLTARWPSEEVDLAGKRVAVIGTGASGIQLIPLVAAVASELTVFHRTANYVLPARSYVLDDLQRDAIKTGYSDIWEQVGQSAMAMPINPANRLIGDVDDAELQRILEAAWEEGGFRFLLETFDDIFVDPESNSAVSEFIRNKIRTIVRDPATAELLCPTTDHPIGAKRPPLGHYYYEAFNRDNVKVVDVNGNPIEDVTEAGIRMADGTEREFDVIIFATGFDALTGALTHIDVRGNDGLSIAEKWEHGPRTHLGTAIDGFPNFFMVFGPQSPFANAPAMIEAGVEAIGAAVSRLRDSGQTRMEVTAEAVEEYASMLDLYFNATIFPAGAKLRAWWLGTNVEGKALGVGVNFGGFPTWAASLRDEATGGFEHYRFSTGEEADPSAWTRREPANADAG
jgi:cation diffusion facilitator CzcD-associated flavoprotein CzcO